MKLSLFAAALPGLAIPAAAEVYFKEQFNDDVSLVGRWGAGGARGSPARGAKGPRAPRGKGVPGAGGTGLSPRPGSRAVGRRGDRRDLRRRLFRNVTTEHMPRRERQS